MRKNSLMESMAGLGLPGFKKAPADARSFFKQIHRFKTQDQFREALDWIFVHEKAFEPASPEALRAALAKKSCLVEMLSQHFEDANSCFAQPKTYAKALKSYQEIIRLIEENLEALQISREDYKDFYRQMMERCAETFPGFGSAAAEIPVKALEPIRNQMHQYYEEKYGESDTQIIFSMLTDCQYAEILIPILLKQIA